MLSQTLLKHKSVKSLSLSRHHIYQRFLQRFANVFLAFYRGQKYYFISKNISIPHYPVHYIRYIKKDSRERSRAREYRAQHQPGHNQGRHRRSWDARVVGEKLLVQAQSGSLCGSRDSSGSLRGLPARGLITIFELRSTAFCKERLRINQLLNHMGFSSVKWNCVDKFLLLAELNHSILRHRVQNAITKHVTQNGILGHVVQNAS
jgi:hypothetical protein